MMAQRKFRFVLLSVMALAILVMAGAAFADVDSAGVPYIPDGRANLYDIAAPVAVYCSFDYPYADDVNMGVLSDIQAWAMTGIEGEFTKVIDVTPADIADALKAADGTKVVQSSEGYTLYQESDGSLTLVGGNYQFNWTPGDVTNC